jgi:diketogulonate reductase-like aldo/keto reductase
MNARGDPFGGTVELRSGSRLPRIGLGVFRTGSGSNTRDAVRHALECGYRHVDTAAIYRNEAEVGQAIRQWIAETNGSRDDVFVTTKLWNDDHGYDEALRAFDASERALGIGRIDLYLIHWPVAGKRADSWRALERIFAEGRCRSIGVSNFTVRHLERRSV